MTDTDHLHAILASPEDDAPRLIYADWLDEQGESDRAEFIKVQCELERLRSVGWRDEWKAGRLLSDNPMEEHGKNILDLQAREKELSARYTEDFLGPIAGLATFVAAWPEDIGWLRKQSGKNATALRVTLRRGFVAIVSCQATDWLEHGPEIVSRHPVEEVRVPSNRGAPEAAIAWQQIDPFGEPEGHAGLGISVCPACNAAALRWARHEAVQRGLVPEGVAQAWGVALT